MQNINKFDTLEVPCAYTCRHLYQRVDKHKATAVGKHLKEMHGQASDDLLEVLDSKEMYK